MPPKKTPSRQSLKKQTGKGQSNAPSAKPSAATTAKEKSKFGFWKNKKPVPAPAPGPAKSQVKPKSASRPWPATAPPAPYAIQGQPEPEPELVTQSQIGQFAEEIVDDILNDLSPEEIELQPIPVPRKISEEKVVARKTSSTPFHYYTPPEEEFLTPPEKPKSNHDVKILYKHLEPEDDHDLDQATTKSWHESEVSSAIKKIRRSSSKKLSKHSIENLPLLSNPSSSYDYGDTGIPLAATSKPPGYLARIPSRTIFSRFFMQNSYPMSSRFSNKDYRQYFASQMLVYKIIHMMAGYLAAILYQMTWTWEREIHDLGPPDLVLFVQNHVWMPYVVLVLYLSLVVVVRGFHKGRNKPYNRIIFAAFVTMFSFKCYCACVMFGPLGTGIITTLTYTLTLSYGLLSILLVVNKYPQMTDLSQVYIYRTAFIVVLITAPVACLFNYVELKITDSAFQKRIGIQGSFLEDYLPSTVLACVIFLWEVFRIKKIVDGAIVALEDDDEYLYGAFFI